MLLEKRDIQNHSPWESCPQAWASAPLLSQLDVVQELVIISTVTVLTVLCGEGSSSSTWTLSPCGLFYQIYRSSWAESYLKRESEPNPALFYWGFCFFYIFTTLTSCHGNNSCILILLLSTRQSQFLLLVNSRTAQGPQPNRGPHSCNISCGWCFLAFWGYILWTAWSHDEWHKYDRNDWQLGHH